jgi:hypothetical protein
LVFDFIFLHSSLSEVNEGKENHNHLIQLLPYRVGFFVVANHSATILGINPQHHTEQTLLKKFTNQNLLKKRNLHFPTVSFRDNYIDCISPEF